MSLQTAEQYEEQEQYELALDEYKKLYATNPKDLGIIERLGHLSSMLDKKDDAIEYYSKILEFDQTNIMAYEQLCDLYYTKDKYKYYTYRGNMKNLEQQYDYAINDYKKAIAHTDKDEEIIPTRFAIAGLYELQKNDNKAIDEYLKILDHDRINEAAYVKLANIYLRQNIITAGISTLEQGLKYGIENPIISEILAQLYLKNGDYQKALDLTKDDLLQIKCHLELGNLATAQDLIKEVENKYKNEPQLYVLKAQVAFIEKDYDKAFEIIEKYNELEKNSPLYYQMRALIFENKGDEFNELLSWAKYHLLRGDNDIAINEYLQAHRANPQSLEVVNALATLLEANNDRTHAMEFYEKIAQLDPKDKSALLKLADFRESIGDYSAQTDYLEKVLELDPKNTEALEHIANAYQKLKNYPSAVEYYNEFLKYSNDLAKNEVIKSKLAKINGLESEASSEGLIDKIMKLFNK